MTREWNETLATWETYDGANSWTTPGGDRAHIALDTKLIDGSTTGWYSWDITSLVQSWLDSTNESYGMMFNSSSDNVWQGFYTSDETIMTEYRPILRVTHYNEKSMLEASDDLTLLDSNDNVIDYVAWGADAGADDDDAVSAGHWPDAAFIDTTPLSEGQTLGRDKNSADTDTPDDWENATSGQADPFGVNSTGATSGARNAYTIPEFGDYAFLAVNIAVIMIIIIGKKKKCER
jgi:hypothetical protein